jgi:hypothetical protein
MSKPPPPPASAAAKSQVEAFGQAFDAAVSRADSIVVDGGGTPTRVEPSDSEQVFANDLELRGVYTGPYTTVEHAAPNEAHLTAPRLKTLETATVPSSQALGGGPPVHHSAHDSSRGSNSAVMAVLALTVIGLAVAFAMKSGLI